MKYKRILILKIVLLIHKINICFNLIQNVNKYYISI